MKLYSLLLLLLQRGAWRNALGTMIGLSLLILAATASAASPQPATNAAVKWPEPLHFAPPRHVPFSDPSPLAGMTFQADAPARERLAITSYKRVGDKITSTQLGIYIPSAPGEKKSDWLVYDAERASPESDYDVILKPQFSPDGRYVLFQFGTPFNTSNFHKLYVLDTQTQALKQLPIGAISYKYASWSPDGEVGS